MEQLGAPTMLVCSNVSPAAIDDDALAAAHLHAAGVARRRARAARSPTRRSRGAGTSTTTRTPGTSSPPPTIPRSAPAWTPSTSSRSAATCRGSPRSPENESSTCSSPTRRGWSWTCCSGAATTAASPARARSSWRTSSRACSTRATPARCRSRSSTTSSGRPTRTGPRSTPCARCSCSRTSSAGRRCRTSPRLDGFAFVELGVDAVSAPGDRGAAADARLRARRAAPQQAGAAVAARGDPDRAQPRRRRRRPRGRRGRRRERRSRALRGARRGAVRARARPPPQPGRGRPRGGRGARRHVAVLLRARRAGSTTSSRSTPSADEDPVPISRIDHITLAQPFDAFDEAGLFYRSVLDLRPGDSAELAAPGGLLRSRAYAGGGVRIALNVPALAGDAPGRAAARRVRVRGRARDRPRAARARRAAAADPRPTTTTTSRPGSSSRLRRRAARARRALRPRRATASSCTSTPRASGDGCSSSSSSGAVATTATEPSTRPCGWQHNERPSRRSSEHQGGERCKQVVEETAPAPRPVRPRCSRRRSASSRGARAAPPDRPQHHPDRGRHRQRRVHPVPVHRLAGRAGLPVGGGRRHPRAVLHQHGDRALHAGHGRDRARRLHAAVEAVGRHPRRGRDPGHGVAGLGDLGGDDRDLRLRRAATRT